MGNCLKFNASNVDILSQKIGEESHDEQGIQQKLSSDIEPYTKTQFNGTAGAGNVLGNDDSMPPEPYKNAPPRAAVSDTSNDDEDEEDEDDDIIPIAYL